MKRNIAIYLTDILENMRDAEQFVLGQSYQQFAADKKTFNAVVRAIEIIGEAAKNVPDSIRSKYPAVPWKEMAGMRDKVIHFCARGASPPEADELDRVRRSLTTSGSSLWLIFWR